MATPTTVLSPLFELDASLRPTQSAYFDFDTVVIDKEVTCQTATNSFKFTHSSSSQVHSISVLNSSALGLHIIGHGLLENYVLEPQLSPRVYY